MMMDKERDRQLLEAELVRVDRRRAELEIVSRSLPPDMHCCGDDQRDEIEDHLRVLWSRRKAIARRLGPASNRREPQPTRSSADLLWSRVALKGA
jgi:hypothetical protein